MFPTEGRLKIINTLYETQFSLQFTVGPTPVTPSSDFEGFHKRNCVKVEWGHVHLQYAYSTPIRCLRYDGVLLYFIVIINIFFKITYYPTYKFVKILTVVFIV